MTVAAKLRTSGATCGDFLSCLSPQTRAKNGACLTGHDRREGSLENNLIAAEEVANKLPLITCFYCLFIESHRASYYFREFDSRLSC